MEIWSEQEDSFSFLQAAPHSISMRNGDGPNHVEIFDITNIPSHHSTISETDCLCDIFGDDGENSTLSCSPASGSFSKEVDDFSLVDDANNDSSGSYHTAVCSEQLSDSSENYEDSKEIPSPSPSGTSLSSTSLPLLVESRNSNLSSNLNGSSSISENDEFSPHCKDSTVVSDNKVTKHPFEHKDINYNPGPTITLLSARSTSPSCNHHPKSPSLQPKIVSSSLKTENTSPSPSLTGTSKTQVKLSTPEPRATSPSVKSKAASPPPMPGVLCPLPKEVRPPSPTSRVTSPLTKHEDPSSQFQSGDSSCSPKYKSTLPLNKTKDACIIPKSEIRSPSPMPRVTSLLTKPEDTSLTPKSGHSFPSPKTRAISPQNPVEITSLEFRSRSVSPTSMTTHPSPEPEGPSFSPTPEVRSSSPKSEGISPFLKSGVRNFSPNSRSTHPSINPEGTSPLSNYEGRSVSPKKMSTSPSSNHIRSSPSANLKCRSPSLKHRTILPSIKPEGPPFSPNTEARAPSPKRGSAFPSPDCKGSSSSPKSKARSPSARHRAPHYCAQSEGSSPLPKHKVINTLLKYRASSPPNIPVGLAPSPKPAVRSLTPKLWATQLPLKPESSSPLQKIETTSSSVKPTATLSSNLSPSLTEIFLPDPMVADLSVEPGYDTSTTNLWAEGKNCKKHKVISLQQLCTRDVTLNTSSGSKENVHKETCGSPKQHETRQNTNPADILQQPDRFVPSEGHPHDSLSDRMSISTECKNKQCRDKEGEVGVGARGEDQWGDKGEGKWGEASYREEQVELSFSARNRKVPASHSPTVRYRQPLSGMIAGCYSECFLATQQQQHKNSVRSQGSQDEHQVCLRTPKLIHKTSNSGVNSSALDYCNENSSMGSELDETDNEVKWFTDLAFKSLSSPQVDYLDVYNSSHRSSTNISQQSTEDSTGVTAWSAYADLRGSTRQENDDPSRHPPSLLPSSCLNRAKRFEMGSFECVDVALESRDETRRGKRTVPKRQIQLRRRDTSESRASENSEVAAETASTTRHSKDILLRQHSTPAAMQEEPFRTECNTDSNERKQKLQKSISLDETSGKTKMATCFIKSVLSKKMQCENKFTNQQVPVQNGKISPSMAMQKSPGTFQSPSFKQSTKTELSSMSSGFPSDCSLSSEDLQQAEPNLLSDSNKQLGSFSYNPHQRSINKSSPSSLQSDSMVFEPQTKNTARLGMRSELVIPFESKKKEEQSFREDGKKLTSSNQWEKNSSDSTNDNTEKTSIAATQVPSMQSGMTNRKDDCHVKPKNHKQQTTRNLFMSKTPEITLKPCIVGEKKTVLCLSPELGMMPLENPEAPISTRTEKPTETVNSKGEDEIEKWIDNDTDKNKGPMHKVRDTKKLVENGYNLSFKATALSTEEKKQEKKPPPMQIKLKAIGRKDDKVLASAPPENQTGDKVVASEVVLQSQGPHEQVREVASLCITPKNALTEELTTLESHDETHSTETSEVNNINVSEPSRPAENAWKGSERLSKLESVPKLPNKEREISTLIVLQDGQPNDGQDPSAPLPLSLTTTSSSRSVSMLLKEKGFQADIGVCDTPKDIQNTITKHVNKIEVPLQTFSIEEIDSGLQRGKTLLTVTASEKAASTIQPLTAVESKAELHQKDPTVSRMEDLEKMNVGSSEETQTAARNTQKTTVSETSSYRQQQSITEETHSTSYIQNSTILSTSRNVNQPTITATISYKHNPETPDATEKPNQLSTPEQAVSITTSRSRHSTVPTTTEIPSYAKQVTQSAALRNQKHSGKPCFYASDDPPSYDERESFSPLLLTNPPARRPHRYHPTSHVPLCSCTPGSPLSPAYPSPRPFGVPPLASPPVRMQDPAYPLAPPPARQCQHRSDAQSLCSQPSSPQTSQPSDTQAPVMFHALQHTPSLPPCPGHLLQPRPEDSRQAPPSLQVDRRAPHHRTPQQATQLVGGSPYNHNAHSPNVSSIETRPQYLCSPQGFAASYSPEYGSEGTGSSGMLYPDSGSSLAYGQNPRRVLLDPETGKYFYIEVPVQPLRKMLFDPETGQYVEVLIPHQTLSQSALFSPSAVPYPSLHNPSMYTPQYMPYSVPSHPPTQPPRHPEVPPPQALHDNEAGFGSSGTQGPKPEAQSHPPLDQNYLESMYYIPTGMTASPNPTSSDFYHKLPPSLPNSEAKRS